MLKLWSENPWQCAHWLLKEQIIHWIDLGLLVKYRNFSKTWSGLSRFDKNGYTFILSNGIDLCIEL